MMKARTEERNREKRKVFIFFLFLSFSLFFCFSCACSIFFSSVVSFCRHDEISLFSSGLKVNPVNIKLLNNMGRLEEKRANFAAAVKYYNKALALEDKSLRTYLNLGNLYSRLSRFDEAEAVYRKVSKTLHGMVRERERERERGRERENEKKLCECPDITSLSCKWN